MSNQGESSNGRENAYVTQDQLTALIRERVREKVAESVAEALAWVQTIQPNYRGIGNYSARMPETPENFDQHCFSGTEGATGLLNWFKVMESEMTKCLCPEANMVGFATSTLVGAARSWWDTQLRRLGTEMANALSWEEFRIFIRNEFCSSDYITKLETEYCNLKMVGSEIEAYTTRSHELAMMCPNMSEPSYKKVGLYSNGLVPQVRSRVLAANPRNLSQMVQLAHDITNQAVEQGILPPRRTTTHTTTPTENLKRKRNDNTEIPANDTPQKKSNDNEGDDINQAPGPYRGNLPECDKCNYHHRGSCNKNRCRRCGRIGHSAKKCKIPLPTDHTPQQSNQRQPSHQNNRQNRKRNRNRGNVEGCFRCGNMGHIKKDCPKDNNKGQDDKQHQKQGKIRGCFHCDDKGHFKRDCPQLNRE